MKRAKRLLVSAAACAAALCLALSLSACGGGGAQSAGSQGGASGTPVSMEESYRVISVTEHNGTSTVTRGGGEQIALYDGLSLQSGDDVVTGAGADLTMLIDSDKYLYAEENTHFWLEASGKEGSSQTTIHLEDGSVLFRLDTKLNAAESFLLSTPSATMSVRGTCGVVEKVNPAISKLYLIEGKVTLGSGVNSTVVEGGQLATVVNTFKPDDKVKPGVPDTEQNISVGKMTERDYGQIALTTGEGLKPAMVEKILEFSVDSGKTMSFGDKKVTPKQAEKLLNNVKAGNTTASEAINNLPNTSSAGEGQGNQTAGGPAAGEPAQQPVQQPAEQPAHKHSYTSKTLTKATCTKRGKVEYSCACGDSYTETIPVLDHNYVEVPGKDATCTETGLTVGMSCSVCNKVKLEQYEIPALGHDIVEDPEVSATCTEPGKAAVQHCTRCDYTAGGEELAALGHKYSFAGGSSASCTAGGYSAYRCDNCGDTYSESTDALGHTWEAIDGNPYYGYACSRCGEKTTCFHNWVKQPDVGATCTEGPKAFYVCQNCPATRYEDLGGKPLGHELVDVEASEPTCEKPGTSAGQRCVKCDYTTCEITPALKHDYQAEKKSEQTCTTNEVIAYTCKRCNDYYEETRGALGHDVTNGETKEATCTEAGSIVGVCNRCKEHVTVVIPAGHEWVDGVCSRCGVSYTEQENDGGNGGSDG